MELLEVETLAECLRSQHAMQPTALHSVWLKVGLRARIIVTIVKFLKKATGTLQPT